ncbi:amidase, partial [Rhizobiaceae sp. 2RAB30]
YETVGKLLLGRDPARAALTRPVVLPDQEALLAGPEERAEYGRMRTLVGPIRETAWPFTSTVDELYWCFRHLQSHEAWAAHGAWISAADRRLGPGVKERFE